MTSISSPTVALKLPRTAKGILYRAKAVLAAMDGNPSFPSPDPPLSTFASDIDALSNAEVAALSRAKGARETRDARLFVVRGDLERLASYVRRLLLAETAAAGFALVESAGMSAKRTGVRHKAELTVQSGRTSGSVHLYARAVAKQAAYEWQYGQDGVIYIDLEPTLQADTTLSGLTPGVRYAFRYRPLYRGGRGDWSQVVWFMAV